MKIVEYAETTLRIMLVYVHINAGSWGDSNAGAFSYHASARSLVFKYT